MNKLLNAIKNNLFVNHAATPRSAWATHADLKDANLLHNDGIILGRNPYGTKKDAADFIRYDGPEHILMTASARTGKGCGAVVPNLLTWPHSVVVLDWRGEIWNITAGYRKKHLGNRVLRFAPTMDAGRSVCYNPLADIRLCSSFELHDVKNIVDMLTNPDGKTLENYWINAAHALLVATILHLMYTFRKKGQGVPTLTDVANFLTRPDISFQDMLLEMKSFQYLTGGDFFNNNVFENLYGEYVRDYFLLKEQLHNTSSANFTDEKYASLLTHPQVTKSVDQLLMRCDFKNVYPIVLAHANNFLALFREPDIAKITSCSEFSVTDLLRDEMAVSLYLLTSADNIQRMRPLYRMILHMAICRLTEKLEFKNGKRITKKQRLLLLLDDFPLLGPMDHLIDTLPCLHHFRIQTFFIADSLHQLHKAYLHLSLTDYCHVQIFYRPNDSRTSAYVSSSLGKTLTMPKNDSFFRKSISYVKRDLLSPCEISQLDCERSIILVNGQPPILAKKTFYHNERFFMARLVEAPAKSDTIC